MCITDRWADRHKKDSTVNLDSSLRNIINVLLDRFVLKEIKKNHKVLGTDRRTDRQKDRQSDL